MTRTISVRTAWKSLPLLTEKAPGTFSQTMYLGRTSIPFRPFLLSLSLISFIIRSCSINRPLRVVSSSPSSSCWRPLRCPATLRSWLTGRTARDNIDNRNLAAVNLCNISEMFHPKSPPCFANVQKKPLYFFPLAQALDMLLL